MTEDTIGQQPRRPVSRRIIPVATTKDLAEQRHTVESLRDEVTEQVAHLHARLNDEIAGLGAATEQSIRDEVRRLDDLIVSVGRRIDEYMALTGELFVQAKALDVRLEEAAELAAQPHEAARLEARNHAELADRIAVVEQAIARQHDSANPAR
jgi:hypothetical protein